MRALNRFVQIKVDTDSGGFYGATGTVDFLEGKVISVGEDAKNIKKGDIVQFPSANGKHFVTLIGGKTYYWVVYENIICVVTNESNSKK